jgi:hypothetical protein
MRSGVMASNTIAGCVGFGVEFRSRSEFLFFLCSSPPRQFSLAEWQYELNRPTLLYLAQSWSKLLDNLGERGGRESKQSWNG